MSTVEVHGSLISHEDDESSDDDEFSNDEADSSTSAPFNPAEFIAAYVHRTDDEELEVFHTPSRPKDSVASKISENVSPQRVSPPSADSNAIAPPLAQAPAPAAVTKVPIPPPVSFVQEEEPTPSLVNLMAMSVRNVELKVPVEKAPPAPVEPPFRPPDKTEDVPGPVVVERDVFGIAYKPFKKKAPEYDAPRGPAFEDEAEFERELKSSVILGAGSRRAESEADQDDEFDIVEDDNSKAAIEIAIGRMAVLAASEAQAPPPILDEDHLSSANAQTQTSTEVSVKFDVRKAAQEAFTEVSNIYGSGLGDIEVLVLQAEAENRTLTKEESLRQTEKAKADLKLDVTATIQEEDEEDEEAEDGEGRGAQDGDKDRADSLHGVVPSADTDAPVNYVARNESIDVTIESFGAGDDTAVELTNSVPAKQFSYSEALAFLRSCDLQQFAPLVVIRNYDEETGWLASLSRPVELNFDGSETELTFPFLLAQLNYSPAEQQHLNIMQSIYIALVPSATQDIQTRMAECPAVGLHWDNIGFQGSDPCTDVNRSMKMLAVLQVLHLISAEPLLAKHLHALSRFSNDYNPEAKRKTKASGVDLTWPFMCVSIMFTKEALQCLRGGVLNKKCNKRRDVMSVINDFHHACFVDFARRLVSDSSKHHAFHLAELRSSVSSNPSQMLRNYKKWKAAGWTPFTYPDTKTKGSQGTELSAGGAGGQASSGKKFDNLEDIEKKMDGKEGEKPSFWSSMSVGKASKFKA